MDIAKIGKLTGRVADRTGRFSPAANEKRKAGIKAAHLRKRMERLAANPWTSMLASRDRGVPNAKRTLHGMPGWQVMAARMVPGDWYALPDLAALMPESSLGTCKTWWRRLQQNGIVDRAPDPTWRGRTLESVPRYLLRLSDKSTERVAEWRSALGEGGGTGQVPIA